LERRTEMRREEMIPLYQELQDRDGMTVLFRKFDTGTWIFQFNEAGKCIGQVCISAENMATIQAAPCVKAGDGKTPQELVAP
jgi:hypothetical protein